MMDEQCEICKDYFNEGELNENGLCADCQADYEERMIHEGLWKNGSWTEKGIREFMK